MSVLRLTGIQDILLISTQELIGEDSVILILGDNIYEDTVLSDTS